MDEVVGVTDTEKAALEARIDELCAENERLRVANASFTGRSIRAGDKMACLEAENAKLRDLMYERAHVYAIQNMTEDELRITATNVMEDNAKLRELLSSYWKAVHCPATPNVPRDYLSEMRELGVELD